MRTTIRMHLVTLFLAGILAIVGLAFSATALAHAEEDERDNTGDITTENTDATFFKERERELEKKKAEREHETEKRMEFTREMENVRDGMTGASTAHDIVDDGDDENDSMDDHRDSLKHRMEIQAEIEKRRAEIRAHLEEKRAELEAKNEDRKERFEERKAHLKEKAKERVRAYIDRIQNRFTSAVERLRHISDRILSRIEKFEEQGKNMDEPRALLTLADDEVAAAEEAVNLFVSEAYAAVDAEDPKTAFERVKELLEVAKGSLKNAHEALVKAIRAIKVENDDNNDDSDDDNDTASTTPSTSTTTPTATPSTQ